jgi:hypothetical protein
MAVRDHPPDRGMPAWRLATDLSACIATGRSHRSQCARLIQINDRFPICRDNPG